MKKKQAPYFRQAKTCSNCKHSNFIEGKRLMACKKYGGYVVADSVCDDYEYFLG